MGRGGGANFGSTGMRRPAATSSASTTSGCRMSPTPCSAAARRWQPWGRERWRPRPIPPGSRIPAACVALDSLRGRTKVKARRRIAFARALAWRRHVEGCPFVEGGAQILDELDGHRAFCRSEAYRNCDASTRKLTSVMRGDASHVTVFIASHCWISLGHTDSGLTCSALRRAFCRVLSYSWPTTRWDLLQWRWSLTERATGKFARRHLAGGAFAMY